MDPNKFASQARGSKHQNIVKKQRKIWHKISFQRHVKLSTNIKAKLKT